MRRDKIGREDLKIDLEWLDVAVSNLSNVT